MMEQDIFLYQDLVAFCNTHTDDIETKFRRSLEFNEFHIECYKKMFYANRYSKIPPAVKELKEQIPELKSAYSEYSKYYLSPRNKYRKGLDIQLGQWYEKALTMYLATRGLVVKKKAYPFPDLEVCSQRGEVLAYFELKYIEAPFLSANKLIKNTFPYESTRYDYEASLTLDTGSKMLAQRECMDRLEQQGIPVHFVWWFDSFHIKGIFAMSSHDVYEFYDNVGDLHKRKQREGDMESHQETGKVYPPLLEMITFSEYLSIIENVKK